MKDSADSKRREGEEYDINTEMDSAGRGCRGCGGRSWHTRKIGSGETDGQEEKGNMTRMCSYAKISKGGAQSADELRETGIIVPCITKTSDDQNFCFVQRTHQYVVSHLAEYE